MSPQGCGWLIWQIQVKHAGDAAPNVTPHIALRVYRSDMALHCRLFKAERMVLRVLSLLLRSFESGFGKSVVGITWQKRKALESSTMAVHVRMATDTTLLPDVRLVVVPYKMPCRIPH